MARRLGSKPTMLIAACVWTLFDVLTPFAASWGFWPLCFVRVGMGLGEGLVVPTQTAVACFWAPTHERGFLLSLIAAGQDLGSVTANLVSPIIAEAGTDYVFFAWASVAACWAVLYSLVAASAPELHRRSVSTGEAAFIQDSRQGFSFTEARHARVEIWPRRILCAPSAWAIFFAHVGQNYTWYIVLSWLPTFFRSHLKLELGQRPELLAAPYLAGMVGVVFFGRFSDIFVSRGYRPRHVRKAAQMTSAVGVALFTQMAARATTPLEASAWVAASLFTGKASTAGFWLSITDICPTSGSTMMGISNTIATVPGIVGQPLTQYILDSTGSWSIVFGVGGAVALTAASIFALLGDDVSLD